MVSVHDRARLVRPRRVSGSLAGVLVALGLLFTASAAAAPPTLTAVGQTQRHLTAMWSLAPAGESTVIEAATSPNTGSDGYFFTENVVVFDTLESLQTSYLSTSQVDPGTYYVHVASFDPDCLPCPIREWSNILTVTIPPDPPPPPPLDTTAPSVVFGGRSTQRLAGLSITATMAEPGKLAVRATVNVPPASRLYRFRRVSKPAVANVPVRLRLTMARRARRAVTRSLRRGRTLRARVRITATDLAGNSSASTRVLRLQPG